MKKRKIFKNKNYTHFDSRKPEYWKYLNCIRNPKWIERHAFYPFIYYKEGRNKFNGEEIIPKSRDIRYSSHIDIFMSIIMIYYQKNTIDMQNNQE